jgi:hypothetical protein
MKIILKSCLVFLLYSLSFEEIAGQNDTLVMADYDCCLGYHDNYTTGNENYDYAIQNAAFTIPGYAGGLNVNRALIHFDLSFIPEGSEIVSARINLFALGPVGPLPGHTGANNNSFLRRVLDPWAADEVTWNHQPSSTDQNQVELPPSQGLMDDYLDVDVTGLVQDMFYGNNYGFLLRLCQEVPYNALVFASLESGDSTNFPSLEVSYLPPCVNIIARKDAVIGFDDFSNLEDQNMGDVPHNSAFTLTGQDGGLYKNRALFQFDLGDIPEGSIIQSARLNLFATSLSFLPGHIGPGNECLLQRVTEEWFEDSVTWNNQPGSSSLHQVVLPSSDTPDQNYINIDVTELVCDMIDLGNFGFILKLEDENPSHALLFCSSDHQDESKYPQLEICYSLALGLEKPIDNEMFILFPNPARKFANIKLINADPGNYSICEIFNSQGKLIYSQTITHQSFKIYTENYNMGLYYVRVISGSIHQTKKLVIN